MPTLDEFYNSMPYATKRLMFFSLAMTAVTSLYLISPYSLLLFPEMIFSRNLQVWRLVTHLFYFGPLSINFLIMFFIYLQYSALLEREEFGSNTADFVWCLFFGSVVLTVAGALLGFTMMSGPLLMYLVYIWCMRRPNGHMGIMFIPFQIPAKYFPWALCVMRFLFGGSIIPDLIGIVAGHLYIFLKDILPERQRSESILKTPAFVHRWFDNLEGNMRGFAGSGVTRSIPSQRAQAAQGGSASGSSGHRWGSTGRRLGTSSGEN